VLAGAVPRAPAWRAWREAAEILDRLGHPDASDVRRRLAT
jgi:hypothetical protein